MGSGLITELLFRSLCFSLQFLLYEKAAEVTNDNSDGILLYGTKVASHNVSRSQLQTLEDLPIPVELLPYLEQGKRNYESFKQILQNTTWEPMTSLSDDIIKVASAHNRESGLTMIYLEFLLYEKAAEVTNDNSDGILLYGTKVASHNVSRSQLQTLEDLPIPVELLPYLEQGKRNYESFKQILQNTTWEPMTSLSDDIIKVASAHNRESGLTMIYLETVVNVSVDVLFRHVWDHMQDYPKWNHNLQRMEVVLDITPRCRLVYKVIHPAGNGIIWSRDIVAIMYWDKERDGIYVALASTSWPALPPSSQYVRATFYPQGYVYTPMPGDPEQTLIRWVNHADAHLAFIPASVVSLLIAKTASLWKYMNECRWRRTSGKHNPGKIIQRGHMKEKIFEEILATIDLELDLKDAVTSVTSGVTRETLQAKAYYFTGPKVHPLTYPEVNGGSKTDTFPYASVELQPYVEQGKRTYESFKQILQNTAWEPMTLLSDDVVKIASAYNGESGLTMFYLETVVNVSADVLFRDDWDHVADYPKWNPNFLRTEVVLDITPRCRLAYKVSSPLGNGLIWSRDAVTTVYADTVGDATYLAFSSTSWPAIPPSSQYVRATFYPQGFVYSPLPSDPKKTLLRWVNHIDLHMAFVPASVINLVLAKACRNTLIYYQEHAETLRKKLKQLKGM
ncbi:unnamed protein product [Darwinula stevensoni]|uniref:START domain-containing protein n=1 Tax=Darwinula stevensoni TaxID=69355 RepID=A0A7R8X7J4_9CRUS|nr:unnamed protein product [Darwinula stevensoni]CAG0889221.1 unnamed protein product [Darwinula stevensoni]